MPIRDIIFDSSALSKQHVAYQRKIQNEPGVRFGIRCIDDDIIPFRGGRVGVILGRPGDGKSSVLAYMASHQAREITGMGKFNERAVVYVTWENTVDEIYAALISSYGAYTSTDFYWGRVPMEDVEREAGLHGAMPIIMIGFSSFRQTKYKEITLDMVMEAVEAIKMGDGVAQRDVDILLADYVQLIPVPGYTDKTGRVSEAIVQLKNRIAVRLDIPVLAAAQAGRQVDGYQVKLAVAADCQHSSTIEQHVDDGFSIWRPIRTEPYDPRVETTVNMWGRHIPLTPELFFMKNWKQRGDKTGVWWPLYFRPELCRLAEMELGVAEIEGDY